MIGIFKIKIMKEIEELRNYCYKEKEKAYQKGYHSVIWTLCKPVTIKQRGRVDAFSVIIKRLDLILKNSVINPTDSRSPEGQGYQSDVIRPNDSQNPSDEIE